MRGKYETHVKPKLDLIAQWARDGAIERDIAKKLGVSESTFSGYKKEHEELMQTLTVNKEVADARVESALYKRAIGYTEKVEKAFKCKHITYDPATGKKIAEDETLETIEEDQHIPADVTAQIFWLKNRKPDHWKDKQDISIEGASKVEIINDIPKPTNNSD